jgi:hypothetical protein
MLQLNAQGSNKSYNEMLQLNAQGSKLIIVVVHLGVVKIYVAAVEALRKKERQDETQFLPPKLMVF